MMKQKYLLLGLLVLVFVGGAIWWKQNSSYAPQGLQSSANEALPHWPRSSNPLTLPVNNHASRNWAQSLEGAANAWAGAKTINYNVVRSGPLFDCYPIVLPPTYEGMHTCSFSEDNGFLAIYGIFQRNGEDPHIYAGLLALNDFYFGDSESEYSSAAWKNRTVCQGLGWIAGVPYQFEPEEESQSCMNAAADSRTVENMQLPNETDFEAMRALYNHLDKADATTVSERMNIANQALSAGQFGQRTASFDGGATQTYHLDLGDGYSLNTTVLRAQGSESK